LSRGELKEGKRPVPPPSEISVKAGSLLFKEGDSSREVYIVKEGQFSVSQRRGSQQVELARLSDRAVFGEMSLLDNQPRSATVRAVTDSRVMVIAPVTFQGMLRIIPTWLLAVLKVITHRLRETSKKINQHTVPDPLESWCFFLVKKCHEFSVKNRAVPSFPWFVLVDEFCLLTRQKREDIQKIAQLLVQRGLAVSTNQQEYQIPDPTFLDILREYQSCLRRKEFFIASNLEPLLISGLETLPHVEKESMRNKDALLCLLQEHVDPRYSISHVLKMFELGVLSEELGKGISFDQKRLAWILKANRDLDKITGRKEASK
jgi:CRP-like cAMP-binding protein